ncbi:unnamed protein product, partial [Ectocarpus sp. 12 AP-2014]
GGSGRLPLPFFDVESVGLKGRWEEMGGNFLLRPPDDQAPKALVHFLGGAFVGAAPHLTYNYLLSGLAEMGFLVVATPYPLGFDYLNVCDGILDRFEQAAVPLAAQYGALPVVGIGHSCGALLQLLITCLFPDTPRAANALISFNNKPVSEAVPGFEELVLPLVMQVLKEGGGQSTLFSTLEMLRETVDNLVDGQVVAESRFAPAVLENEVVPLVRQVLQITDQLPALLQSIADGTREFTPTPEETRDVVSKMYRARRTIMIRFENDSIDESERMKDVIQEGKTLLRMRRPLVEMELRYEIIKGNHITPLTQNVFLKTPVDSIDPLFGVRQGMKKEFLKTVNHLGQILVDWLEESAPPVPPSSGGGGGGSGGIPEGVGEMPSTAASGRM